MQPGGKALPGGSYRVYSLWSFVSEAAAAGSLLSMSRLHYECNSTPSFTWLSSLVQSQIISIADKPSAVSEQQPTEEVGLRKAAATPVLSEQFRNK